MGLCGTGEAVQRLNGTGRCRARTIWLARASTLAAPDVDGVDGPATRSQDGHMVRVVGGVICM
uniref:Homeodomain associated leucine zipper protein n=1 Tax=Solanum tuberosum TaxID=4113 RepID=M1AXL3_SOLTU